MNSTVVTPAEVAGARNAKGLGRQTAHSGTIDRKSLSGALANRRERSPPETKPPRRFGRRGGNIEGKAVGENRREQKYSRGAPTSTAVRLTGAARDAAEWHYDGRRLLGFVTGLPDRPQAWLADGRLVGSYGTRKSALDALLAAAREVVR